MDDGGCGCILIIIVVIGIACFMLYSWDNGNPKIKDTAPDWLQTTNEERLAKARCAQFLETFPDNRLLEIVKRDSAGWTMQEIADRYNVTEHCLKKRINRDSKLYKAIKAEYIANL